MKIILNTVIIFLIFSMILGTLRNYFRNKTWFRKFRILQHIITVLLLFVHFISYCSYKKRLGLQCLAVGRAPK